MVCRDNLDLIDRLGQPGPNKHPLVFATRFSQTYFSQYCLLTQRNFTSYYRNSGYNCTRFIFGIILGLLFGSALWGIGQKRWFFSCKHRKCTHISRAEIHWRWASLKKPCHNLLGHSLAWVRSACQLMLNQKRWPRSWAHVTSFIASYWATLCLCRSTLQDLNNVLGALYLVIVFLGIINATSVQPVAFTERSVSSQINPNCPNLHLYRHQVLMKGIALALVCHRHIGNSNKAHDLCIAVGWQQHNPCECRCRTESVQQVYIAQFLSGWLSVL